MLLKTKRHSLSLIGWLWKAFVVLFGDSIINRPLLNAKPILVFSNLNYRHLFLFDFALTFLMCFRVMTKNLFNPQFGSIFRTCHNPTYFSRRLSRFSDIYMASLSCLLNYDPSYTFYPRRTPLQHEAPLWMDQLCTGCMKTPHLDDMASIRWELCSPHWLFGHI